MRHATLPLTKALGSTELASADGMRFVVPVRSVHAAANPKYFGRGKGVTYINYTSARSIGFFGFVVPDTLRDSDGRPLRSVVAERRRLFELGGDLSHRLEEHAGDRSQRRRQARIVNQLPDPGHMQREPLTELALRAQGRPQPPLQTGSLQPVLFGSLAVRQV